MTANLETGLLYALLAGIFWGISPLFLKKGMIRSNVSAATVIQQGVIVAILAAIAGARHELFRTELPARALWSFIGAGVVGASLGKIFYNRSIDNVGASRATSIKNSDPIITAVLAVAMLGERLTIQIAAGVLLIVAGILLLTRVTAKTEGRRDRLLHFLYPLLAVFCYGITPVFKKMGIAAASLPALGALVMQMTGFIVIVTAGRLLKIKPKWERIPAQPLIFFALSGVAEALGSLCTFYALIYAPAVVVSPVWRISPLVTFLFSRFTLKGVEVVTLRDGLAASLIVGGVLLMSQR